MSFWGEIISRKYLMMQRLKYMRNVQSSNRRGRVNWCMFSEKGFCLPSEYKKTTRTFEHRWEAWRVLALQKYKHFSTPQAFHWKKVFPNWKCGIVSSTMPKVHKLFALSSQAELAVLRFPSGDGNGFHNYIEHAAASEVRTKRDDRPPPLVLIIPSTPFPTAGRESM